MIDVIGDRLTVMFSDASAIPHVKDGKLVAIAVSPKRLDELPDVPAVAEVAAAAGVPGYAPPAIWYGIVAPRGTPKDIVAKVNAAMAQTLKKPDVREKLIAAGALPAEDPSSENFASVIAVGPCTLREPAEDAEHHASTDRRPRVSRSDDDNHRKFYIDGAWRAPALADADRRREPRDRRRRSRRSPPAAAADVDRAVAAARRAFAAYSLTSRDERIALLAAHRRRLQAPAQGRPGAGDVAGDGRADHRRRATSTFPSGPAHLQETIKV